MRIAIDARESGTSTGRYIDKLVEYLHKLQPQHEIAVLTKAARVEFMKAQAPNFTVLETPYKEFTFGEQLGFKKQLESLKPDLVHFGMVQQPVWYKGRVVTTMHDLITLRFRNPAKNPLVFTVKQQIYKWVNKRAASKSVRVIVPTQFVKDDVANYTHVPVDKIIVTYESADKITEAAEPYQQLKEKRFIMYVGRPQPHKNLKRLIDAFAILKQQQPDLHLALAGKTDQAYQQLQTYCEQQGIIDVVFTGWITDGQLRWLYEHAQAYVFPSLSEGFGLPALEAMYYDLPVVCSNTSCLPEVNGPAAHYFDPLDTQAMAAAINDVLNDKVLRSQLIKAGQTQRQKYSWQRMAEQTLAVYEEVLKRPA